MTAQSIGFVWQYPTQFDDPFFRYLTSRHDLGCTVYYYGFSPASVRVDPEMGRQIGWVSDETRGYPAVLCKDVKSLEFARMVVGAGHDLIITEGYHSPQILLTTLLAKSRGLPVGLRLDSIFPPCGKEIRHARAKKLILPWLFRLYATGHPVGHQAAKYLQNFGFAADALFFFPYAVDHRWFARESCHARRDRAALRASWGLPPDADVVCGVIKFSEREDPLTLVRAVRVAQERNPKLVLLLVGDGPLRAAVESAAAGEIGKRIVLAGYQKFEMLPRVYAASDVFVHPAEGPWEVSVTEALACGIPVIASERVGSAREIIEPNGFGCLFQYKDHADLAIRIEQVLSNAQLRDCARQRGLKALESWDYPATADRLTAALRHVKIAAGKSL